MAGNRENLIIVPDRAAVGRLAAGRLGECPGDGWARLLLPLSGHGEISGRRNRQELRSGQLYLAPGGEEFRYGCGEALTWCWCRYRPELTSGSNLFARWHPGVMVLPSEAGWEERFRELPGQLLSAGLAERCRALAWLYEMTARFLQAYPPELSNPYDYRRELLQPVLERIAAEPERHWTVEELAALLTVSKVSCHHLFREVTGMPPARWITLQRVAKARKLLEHTADSLNTVAEKCGFCDAFHLSRVFKQAVGVAPRTFRVRRDDADLLP